MAMISDNMGGVDVGVLKAGYWIENFQKTKNPNSIQYMLYDFNEWFDDFYPAIPNGRRKISYEAVYDRKLNSRYFGFGSSNRPGARIRVKRYFNILTNTSGINGAKSNLDTTQCWRTRARKNCNSMNGYDNVNQQLSRINSQALFSDGKYKIHV